MTALRRLRRFAAGRGIALHTVQVHHGGEPVVEAACAPLTLHTPQRMYSVTKTLTGLAIGLLAGEGRLALDQPLCDHFPDLAPFHPFVAATTVRDALAMRGPHPSTTFKRYDGPWLESYFRVPPTHRPGTLFTYDTSGSYTLAALVERTAGVPLVDYLRPRLLDPIGASPSLRILPGADGFASGGSGLICTPDDLRRLASLLLAGGRHQGEQVVPADFLAEATSPQADTSLQGWGDELAGGYGLQTWLPRSGGWLMFGLGGQLVHGDPARDLSIVITADTQACPQGDQQLVDLVLGRLADDWVRERDAGGPATGSGQGDADGELAWPAPPHAAEHAVPASGRWLPESGGTLGGAALLLDVDAEGGTLASAGPDGWTLPFALGRPTALPAPDLARATGVRGPAVVTAGWSGPGTLDLRVDVIGDELAVLRLRLVVDGAALTLRRQGYCEALAPGWNGSGSYAAA